MGWKEVRRHNNVIEPDEVTYAVCRRDGSASGAQAIIRVARPMIDRLGWRRGQKVRVLWGTDEHYGRVRLELGGARGVILRPRSPSSTGSLAVATYALPDWVWTEPRPATAIKASLVGGGIEFDLPKEALK